MPDLEMRQDQTADDISDDGDFHCSPDSTDLLVRASAILSFLAMGTSEPSGSSRSGTAGLFYMLEYCSRLIDKAGRL